MAILGAVLVLGMTFGLSNPLQAGIINGNFEANHYTGAPIGWTANGVIFVTNHVYRDVPGTFSDVLNGSFFVSFNIIDEPKALTGNALSQIAVADGTRLEFSWNRLRNSYVGNGGPTLQVAYQDLTAAGALTILDIDCAPAGNEPSGTLPWRQVSLPGFTQGHSYFIEFRAGSSEGVTPTLSHSVAYTLDDVAFGAAAVSVPEPSAIALWTTGAAGLVCVARRRRNRTQ